MTFRYRAGLWSSVATMFAMGAVSAEAAAPPCVRLRQGSAILRSAYKQINAPVERRGTDAYRLALTRAYAAIDGVRWPFAPSGEFDFVFRTADFDRDGRRDTMTETCGSGRDRVCFLTFDRGDGKAHVLEKGFMDLRRLDGRFYVAWDYDASPATIRSGGPKTDFSEYFLVTRRGFSEVCHRDSPS